MDLMYAVAWNDGVTAFQWQEASEVLAYDEDYKNGALTCLNCGLRESSTWLKIGGTYDK